MKTIVLVLSIVLWSYGPLFSQEIPKEFVDELSKAITPFETANNDSIDMYMVGLLLAPDGTVLKIYHTQGTPENVRQNIRDRVAVAYIHLTPLGDYWKKFCKANEIKEYTCILQPMLVRFEDTDKQSFSIEQLSTLYSKGLDFEDSGLFFRKNINFIYFPPKITRLVHKKIVE